MYQDTKILLPLSIRLDVRSTASGYGGKEGDTFPPSGNFALQLHFILHFIPLHCFISENP